MMPEDRAARVAHCILSPQSSWEEFERMLLSQQRPDWNQAGVLNVDAIRLECVDGYFPWMFWYADVDPEEIDSERHRRLLKMYAPKEETNGNS